MGIAGLWPLLEPTCQPVTLETLEGKILAVDVSIWIYQAQLGYPGEVRCPHLALLVSRMCKLLYYKIRPVFVFDGEGVPSFKSKVLNERRLKKHTEDIVLTHAKKRTLLDLATSAQTQSEIDAVKNKLTAASSKRQRLENDLFDILPPKPVEVVDLSDDDEDIVVVDAKKEEPSSRTIDILMDERERIRNSRLRPSQIPSDSKSFSQFQLERLLCRSRLNTHINQLVENKDPASVEVSSQFKPGAYDQHPLFSIADGSEDSSSDSDEGEFYSKTTMIEDHVKRGVGHRNAEAVMLRTDDWSSDSGTDDFIDVPSSDPLIEQQLFGKEAAEQKVYSTDQPSTSDIIEKQEADSSASSEAAEPWEPAGDSDTRDSQWDDKGVYRSNVSSSRDSECYKDLQDFLTACGFPWIEAPGEAEAQCVELENLGLVQGVISDDSDVWAFGVKDVYRHLFSKNKNVQHYDSRIVRQSLGLSQADFVGLAVLSGGDYSSGLAGVGIVNAVELLSEFAVSRTVGQNQSQEKETLSTLGNVEKWMATFDSTEDPPEPIALRRKLRAIIKKNNDMERIKSIVNPDVVAAYFRPNVDKSREKFRWKSVDMERVRAILYSKLGWDDDKFNKQTLTPLQRWNEFITGGASYQRHITSFTHKLQQSPDEQRVALTKRVETALANLAKRTGSSSNIASLAAKPLDASLASKPLEKKISRKQSRPKRKRTEKSAAKDCPKDLQLSEESDSDKA
ncbi:hypothetical protein V3C99_002934 [Haemonchus contortus]